MLCLVHGTELTGSRMEICIFQFNSWNKIKSDYLRIPLIILIPKRVHGVILVKVSDCNCLPKNTSMGNCNCMGIGIPSYFLTKILIQWEIVIPLKQAHQNSLLIFCCSCFLLKNYYDDQHFSPKESEVYQRTTFREPLYEQKILFSFSSRYSLFRFLTLHFTFAKLELVSGNY